MLFFTHSDNILSFYGYDSHNISIYWIERTCKAFKITKVMIFYLFIYKNNKITAHSYITYCFYYHTSETIAVLMLLSCFTRKNMTRTTSGEAGARYGYCELFIKGIARDLWRERLFLRFLSLKAKRRPLVGVFTSR
ncbi:hypothetical protein ACVV4G_06735 [Escherichia coli]